MIGIVRIGPFIWDWRVWVIGLSVVAMSTCAFCRDVIPAPAPVGLYETVFPSAAL